MPESFRQLLCRTHAQSTPCACSLPSQPPPLSPPLLITARLPVNSQHERQCCRGAERSARTRSLPCHICAPPRHLTCAHPPRCISAAFLRNGLGAYQILNTRVHTERIAVATARAHDEVNTEIYLYEEGRSPRQPHPTPREGWMRGPPSTLSTRTCYSSHTYVHAPTTRQWRDAGEVKR
jgi:hypothetical protein